MQLSTEDIGKVCQAVTDALINASADIGTASDNDQTNTKKKYKSNEGGFVRVQIVDDWLATLEAKDRAWLPCWFNWPRIHLNSVDWFSNEARLSSRQNLANRNWVLTQGQRMVECKPIKWITIPKTGPDIPWDEPNRYTLIYGDNFVPNSWSWGWDDKDIDEAAILAKVQAFYKNGAPGSGGK